MAETKHETTHEESASETSAGARRHAAKGREPKGRGMEGYLVDLGRRNRKDIDRLRKGRGPLMEDVEDAIQELRDNEALPADARPVIVVVAEKRAKLSGVLPVILPPGIPAAFPLDFDRDDNNDDEDEEDEDDED